MDEVAGRVRAWRRHRARRARRSDGDVLAEIFFCITVAIALFTSRGWIDAYGGHVVDTASLRRVATATTVLIYCQILVGATMRHTGAGLAIPDFPLMFGHLWPTHWDAKIAVHFAHRVGALLVALAVLATGVTVFTRTPLGELRRPAALLVALVSVQITLGALTVLSKRDVWINSVHVVCGALVLTTSLVLTLRTWRAKFAMSTVRLKPETTVVGNAGGLGSVRLQADHPPRARA